LAKPEESAHHEAFRWRTGECSFPMRDMRAMEARMVVFISPFKQRNKMELAVHWHKCQDLPKNERILSREYFRSI
jgi:hypothetical protein